MLIKPKTKDVITVLVCYQVVILCGSLYYLSEISSPLIQRDAWHFLRVFAERWLSEGVRFEDLLYKRSLSDHAQPLNKLVLFALLKYFHLDFRIEALLGFSALALISLVFFLLVRKNLVYAKSTAIPYMALVAILFAPAAAEVFYWPLAIFSYVYTLLGLVACLIAWRALHASSWEFACLIAVFPCIFVLMGDTAGLILVASIAIPLTLVVMQEKSSAWRRKAFLFAVIVASAGTFFALANWKFIGQANGGGASGLLGTASPVLWNLEWGNIVVAIFSNGLIQKSKFPEGIATVLSITFSISILVVFVAKAIFLKYTGIRNIQTFIGSYFVFVSLVSATLVVAVRSQGAADALSAPRYVTFLHLLPIGLFLIYLGSNFRTARKNFNHTLVLWFVNALASFVVAVTVYYFYKNFTDIYYTKKWDAEVSRAIITSFKENRFIDCTPTSQGLCEMSDEQRDRLLQLLSARQLNLFNPRFQALYGIQPFRRELRAAKVLEWGPKGARRGVVPNPQPGGQMGMWFKLSFQQGLDEIVLQVGDLSFATTNNGGGLLTAAVSLDQVSIGRPIAIKLLDKESNSVLEIGVFGFEP